MAKKQIKKIMKEGSSVKKNPPIYVDSPNDPRLKSYSDSLDFFNLSKKRYKPNYPEISKEEYDKLKEENDKLPYYSFDEQKYKKDVSEKKQISFEDYVYQINDKVKGFSEKDKDAFFRNIGNRFKDTLVNEPLKNGNTKTYYQMIDGELDKSFYSINDSQTKTSRYYNDNDLMDISNPNIKPIKTITLGKKEKEKLNEISLDSKSTGWYDSSKPRPKFNNTSSKKFINEHYPIATSSEYQEPIQPVIFKKDLKNTKKIEKKQVLENIQKLSTADLNQIPIDIQPQQMQQVDPRFMLDKPNYNDGEMDMYHKRMGIYENGGTMKKENYSSSNATKKTSKKVLNKIMPISAEEGASMSPWGTVNPNNEATMSEVYGYVPSQTKMGPSPSSDYDVASTYDANTSESSTKKPGYFERNPFNFSAKLSTNNLIAGTIAASNALIPNQIKNSNQNTQPMMYNPRPMGDGTSAIGKYGLNFEGGGSLNQLNKDNFNALTAYAYQNAPNYGADQYNHGIYGNDIIAAFNKANPNQAINPADIGAYQQDMLNNPNIARTRNPNKQYSPNDNKFGAESMQQYYQRASYEHQDAKGNTIGYKPPSTNLMSQQEFANWNQPVQQPVQQWESNNQGIGIEQPTTQQPINPSFANTTKKAQKANWYTKEKSDANSYSVDSVREAKLGYRFDNDDGDGDEDLEEANAGIQMLGKGQIKPMGDNPYSHPMMWSKGPSHNDEGIPIQIGNQRAEIQGGEGVYPEANGNVTVFGGMRIPNLGPETKEFSGKTFQSVAKEIGKQEEKNQKMNDIASLIEENNDPSNRFDSLKIGSAIAMKSAFKMRSEAATQAKDSLATIQRMMHEDADKEGIGYEKAHEIYAKQGATIKAIGGYQYDSHGGRPFDKEKAAKLGYKGKENTREFQKFLQEKYPDQVKKQGIGSKSKSWIDDIWGKRTDAIVDDIVSGKPSVPKFGPDSDPDFSNTYVPKTRPSTYDPGPTGVVSTPPYPNAPWRAGMNDQEAQDNINNRKGWDLPKNKMSSLADQNKPRLSDFLGEINYLGKQPDQVLSPQYRPYLESPYQVSFQDRRNLNQSTFNEVSKQLQATGSAASLAALAGQKYEADNQVNAEEFRTNQGIYSSITNQNYNILNDAAKTNIGLKDQQFVRQSQAKSNTDAQKAQALASISTKLAANRYENMNIRLVEERSGYRINPDTNKMEWEGGPHQFNPYGSGQGTASNTKKTFHYDKDGTLTGHDEVDYSDSEDTLRRSKALKAQRSVYTKFGNLFKK